ncbi:MAG: hypothetical protein K6F99_02005 [Lachnospiraceae bacterium]|nr:hypothetical protein [Lachnospiraceae bacterium]
MIDNENTDNIEQTDSTDNLSNTVTETETTAVEPQTTEETVSSEAEESVETTSSNEKGSYKPTLLSLLIRIIAGGYLIYLSYQLITGGGEKYRTLSIVAAAVFTVFALVIIVLSIKHLINKNFTMGRN